MVIDSSVLCAILLNEPEAESYRRRLADTQDIYISAVSIVESSMVIEYKGGEKGSKKYDELLKIIAPTIIRHLSKIISIQAMKVICDYNWLVTVKPIS